MIAVAARDITPETATGEAEELEKELTLLGLVGIEDPPRPGVASAISSCRAAGIRIAMVTGDHPATAKEIASEVGMLDPDAPVLEGNALPEDEDLLGALVDHDGTIISRVTPEQKVFIARALRKRGHVGKLSSGPPTRSCVGSNAAPWARFVDCAACLSCGAARRRAPKKTQRAMPNSR